MGDIDGDVFEVVDARADNAEDFLLLSEWNDGICSGQRAVQTAGFGPAAKNLNYTWSEGSGHKGKRKTENR